MTDILGPTNANNSTTVRQSDSRSGAFGASDTWFKDCSSPAAGDGTYIGGSWMNSLIAKLRNLVRGNGNLIAGSPVILENDLDDTILVGAVWQMIQRGQANFAADSGTADALVVNPTPSVLEYKAGTVINVAKGASANATQAPTATISGLGAKTLQTFDGRKIAKGALLAGCLFPIMFDGTNLRVLAPVAAADAPQMAGFSRLSGSAPGSTKTASWTIDQIVAVTALGGLAYGGQGLSLSLNAATTGAGGMDTGSPPTSADLSVYAIYNPSTQTWAALGCAGSTSRGTLYSGSNMPAGYTASVLIWSGVTNGTNLFAFAQKDRAINTAPITVGSGLTGVSYSALPSLASAVPANANTWFPEAQCTTTSATSNIWLSPTASNGPGSSIMWSDVNRDVVTGTPVLIIAPQAGYYSISVGQTWAVSSIGYII
jgi:hypothetical protein